MSAGLFEEVVDELVGEAQDGLDAHAREGSGDGDDVGVARTGRDLEHEARADAFHAQQVASSWSWSSRTNEETSGRP